MVQIKFILDGKTRIAKSFKGKSVADIPLLKKEFYINKNNINPKYISATSNIRFHWLCNKGHSFQSAPNGRTQLNVKRNKEVGECPYCSNQLVCDDNSFATLHPELAKFWDHEKNDLTPKEIVGGHTKKVHWKCDKGHSFERSPYQQVNQKIKCPSCGDKNGKNITKLAKDNSLSFKFPEIARQWHSTKNGKLKPKDIIATNPTKEIWWKCEKGDDHVFKALCYSRVTEQVKCPFCSGHKISKTNNIAYLYPELSKQWDHKKNGKLKPEKLTAGSQKAAWWLCSKNHSWKAVVHSRTRGSGCKICSGRGISYLEIRFYAELKSILNEVKWGSRVDGYQVDILLTGLRIGIEVDGNYWHKKEKKLNHDIKKGEYLKKKKIKLIRVRENGLDLINSKLDYNCDLNYQKKETVNRLLYKIKSITKSKKASRKINIYLKKSKFVDQNSFQNISQNLPAPIFENSLAYNHKDISSEWDYNKNKPLVPEMFKSGSNLEVWWICKKKHSYPAKIANRTALKRGCPYCGGRYATKENNLQIAYPKIAKEWHPKFNLNLMPSDFLPTSGQYVWWLCKNGHAYRKTIARRIKQKAKCPCMLTHKRKATPLSFSILRKEFDSKKNKKKLADYRIDSTKEIWWKCKKVHSFKKSIFRRTFYMERCPKCEEYAMEFHRDLHSTFYPRSYKNQKNIVRINNKFR